MEATVDYAKRAEEIAKTDYIARASGCLLHWGSCKYLLGKSCDCDRRDDVQSVADTLRGFDMAHLAELRAAHDAGVAEERARCASICEGMVVGGRAWDEGQRIAGQALLAAAESIRKTEPGAVRSLQQSPDYAALAHAELAAIRGGGA